MDDYDFEKIDREMEKEIAKNASLSWQYDRWEETNNPDPPEYDLIPIGPYNGVDIPNTVILDDSYIVYFKRLNPEYSCEVIIN